MSLILLPAKSPQFYVPVIIVLFFGSVHWGAQGGGSGILAVFTGTL
jgi:hypothetical protein